MPIYGIVIISVIAGVFLLALMLWALWCYNDYQKSLNTKKKGDVKMSDTTNNLLAVVSFIFPVIFVFYLFKAIIKYARS